MMYVFYVSCMVNINQMRSAARHAPGLCIGTPQIQGRLPDGCMYVHIFPHGLSGTLHTVVVGCSMCVIASPGYVRYTAASYGLFSVPVPEYCTLYAGCRASCVHEPGRVGGEYGNLIYLSRC